MAFVIRIVAARSLNLTKMTLRSTSCSLATNFKGPSDARNGKNEINIPLWLMNS